MSELEKRSPNYSMSHSCRRVEIIADSYNQMPKGKFRQICAAHGCKKPATKKVDTFTVMGLEFDMLLCDIHAVELVCATRYARDGVSMYKYDPKKKAFMVPCKIEGERYVWYCDWCGQKHSRKISGGSRTRCKWNIYKGTRMILYPETDADLALNLKTYWIHGYDSHSNVDGFSVCSWVQYRGFIEPDRN